jgi:LacI family transcriptional regulator
MAVTILQIAERLKLSHSTVSRVLNNKTDTYIAPETRRRVLTVAREMGYRPNLAARSLRHARTNMVGLFASPYIGIWSGIAPDIARAASRVLHARHLDVFFAFAAEESEESDGSSGMPAWRYDGAILLQQPTRRTLERLHSSGQPFVAVNEVIEGGISVLGDEIGGVSLALSHLWDLGHRRIAYANVTAWHMPHYSVGERHDAYIAFLRERGAEPVLGHDTVLSEHREGLVAWLRRTVSGEEGQGSGATAILAYDHIVAVDLLAAAQALQLRIPEDVSLICFNDEYPVARVAPPLTVVAPQGDEMGRTAAELLIERMKSPRADIVDPLRIPAKLIVRASTAAPCERR